MSRYDVILIGSGIASLTCAALLSKKGKSVLVLEQYNKAGGYMHCFSRFGDRFDTGAHYVGAMDAGQPFHTLLNYLGVYDSNLFTPLDPEGFDVFRFPEFEISLPKGYDAVIARVSERFPHDAAAVSAYFSRIQEVVTHFPTYRFSEQFDMNMTSAALETPLSAVVESLTSNPALQCLFYSYCTLHGVEPHETPFGLHAIITDSLIRGPHGLSQGGDALTRKYVEAIKTNGGEVLTKKCVVSIENTGKLAHAVITADGERHEAEWVISGIHPKRTFELLSDPSILSPVFRSRLANLKESVGIFGIYAACSESPELDRLRNYYYFSSSDPNRILKTGEIDAAPNAIFLAPAARLPEKTKNAFTLNIHAASPIEWLGDWPEGWKASHWGKRPKDYETAKETFAEKTLALIDRYQPGFRRKVSQYATSTPLTNLHFNGSPEGSAYGIYHSIQNTGSRALGPRSHIANLLLTGQNTLFPGLMGAAVSALRTSGHIIGIKSILKELRELGQTQGQGL
jgi:all-trans-retinol 13,14-reductase